MQAFNELQQMQYLIPEHQQNSNQQQKQKQNNLIPQKIKKSRAAKKRDKIQQRQEIYVTQQARTQRRRVARQRVKAKQRQQIKGMTKQQAIQFIEKKKQQKQQLRQRMIKAQQTGLSIFVDCAYQQYMNTKQRRSLGVQFQLIYKAMRHVDNPCSLRICNVSGSIQQTLNAMGLKKLPIGIHSESVLQMGQQLNKQLIYLSPDASDQLQQVSSSCAYVIGGLVDRTIVKNASLIRANQLGIKAYCLPIKQFMTKRKCLNLDHVCTMLVKAQSTGNWKQAFDASAPKRFSKQSQQNQKEDEKDISQQSEDYSDSSLTKKQLNEQQQ